MIFLLFFTSSIWAKFSIQEDGKESAKTILFQSRSSDGASKNKSPVIRFSVVESWSEPFAFYDGERNLVDGLIKEVIEGLARKMNAPFEHVYTSRNRVESGIEKGMIDVRCFINEAWTEKPDIYFWTMAWFEISNLVVWKKGRTPLKKVEDLDGKTLGTTAGYFYKTLNESFKSGKVKRSDVATEAMNLALLQKDRIDYSVVEQTSFEWMVKEAGSDVKNFEFLLIEKLPIKCAILKNSKIKLEDMNEAIVKLRHEGVFKRMEVKYGYRKY